MTKCLTFSTSSLSRGWLSRCSKVGAMHTARFFASILLVSERWLMWWNRHSRCCRRRLFALGNFSAILKGGNNRKKKQLGFSINHSSNFNLDEGERAKTELSVWHFVVRLQLLISLFSNLWRVHRKATEKFHFNHPFCARDFFLTAPTSAHSFSLPSTLKLQWVYSWVTWQTRLTHLLSSLCASSVLSFSTALIQLS